MMCDECARAFPTPQSLAMHTRRAHLGYNPWANAKPKFSGALALVDDDSDWEQYAACRDVPNKDIFFPDRGASPLEALAVCAQCSVRSECLDFAVKNGEYVGVWGGKTARQRRVMRAIERRNGG